MTIGTCLFCRGNGPFNTIEHIIPESLGNDELTLQGLVCDSCQRYLGSNVEKQALEKTMFAFWRTFQGIKTKKGKLPSVNLDPPVKRNQHKKELLPARHPRGHYGIGLVTHDDYSVEIVTDSPHSHSRLLTKQRYEMVLTPWHLSIIGRFLGKMGLELVALHDPVKALSKEFDQIRKYVREGSTSSLWPFYIGKHGSLEDLKTEWSPIEGTYEQDIFCYQFSLGITNKEEYVFAFHIGIDLFFICLSHNNQLDDEFVTKSVEGVPLQLIHYPKGSW